MMVKSTMILNLSSVILLSTGIHSILMIYSNGTREIDLVICAWFHGILTLAFLIWILQRKNQRMKSQLIKGALNFALCGMKRPMTTMIGKKISARNMKRRCWVSLERM